MIVSYTLVIHRILVLSHRLFSHDNLAIDNLRGLENTDCLLRRLDAARHHRPEGRSHAVGTVVLRELHT